MSSTTTPIDCLIAGGGYVGLSTAVAIKASAPHLAVTLIDAAPEDALSRDERASAIAAAAARMLDQLGLWQGLLEHAQPIREMIVTDSRTNDPVRPVFLTFGDAEDPDPEAPFAHMVPNKALVGALRERAKALGVDLRHGETVADFADEGAAMRVGLGSGAEMMTRLLIAADGVQSKLRERAGIRTVRWAYDQMGIVTTISHERDHEGRAEEHFLPGGPFATLPLPGKRTSLVWTEPTAVA
ncbi:FAD-dependent monooxygenase, partial [Rhizobiaceae bacterium]|nr:FAD-dependent monooxygenase [Rhizobiaceae bacterium]